MQNITYKSVPVKQISLRFLKNVPKSSTVYVGIDVGKNKLFVSVRWTPPRSKRPVYENPWTVENPNEIKTLITKLLKIKAKVKIQVGLESTGTYGDPLRQALSDATIDTYQLRTKLTHDYAEIFDGVPSQHDGKDAAVIAELLAQNKGTIWNYTMQGENENEMRYHVRKLADANKETLPLQGKLEAFLARHWPEITGLLPLTSMTLLKLLEYYGGPTPLHRDIEAKNRIRRFSRSNIDEEKAKEIVKNAKTTNGVRQQSWDMQYAKDIAQKLLASHRQTLQSKKRLKELVEKGSSEEFVVLQRMAKILGNATACVVWCNVGNPKRYHCADAWVKAMGLNLTERSSGEYQSRMRISKRGNKQTRRWLYMSTLRWVQESPVKEWYQRKKCNTGTRIRGTENGVTGGKAILAVTRKLVKGIWFALVRDVPFDPEILFREESSKRKDRTCGAKSRFRSKRKK